MGRATGIRKCTEVQVTGRLGPEERLVRAQRLLQGHTKEAEGGDHLAQGRRAFYQQHCWKVPTTGGNRVNSKPALLECFKIPSKAHPHPPFYLHPEWTAHALPTPHGALKYPHPASPSLLSLTAPSQNVPLLPSDVLPTYHAYVWDIILR